MTRNLAVDPNVFASKGGYETFAGNVLNVFTTGRGIETISENNPATWETKACFGAMSEPKVRRISVQLGEKEVEILVEDGQFEDLLRTIIEKFNNILSLKQNWDSYDAPMISPKNAEAAFEIILSSLKGDRIIPEIFPTPLGGIEIRWANAGKEFELEIIKPNKFEALFVDENHSEELEIEGDFRNPEDRAKAEDFILQTVS